MRYDYCAYWFQMYRSYFIQKIFLLYFFVDNSVNLLYYIKVVEMTAEINN